MKKNYSRIIEAVGLNIRIARKKARLTQAELAKLSDVSRNQIAKIEQGKNSDTGHDMHSATGRADKNTGTL
ncbi:MAG: helix-turn-helix domain-containing protein [Phascolarctobacterium sp.]|nr:helix-turn-helix domain-containing protein [Phascolarctobacterium sp.]